MFAKLLKHDSKAILKHWWLGAAACLILALVGGFSYRISLVDYTKYDVFVGVATAIHVLARLGLFLFPLFTSILIIIRYYKHFFTDEGYLTFTLPVRKNTLLNSKIVTAIIFTIVSNIVRYLSLFVIVLIGDPKLIHSEDFLFEVSPLGGIVSSIFFGYGTLADYVREAGSYAVVSGILIILIILMAYIVEILFIYGCITLAASLVKKHKVLTAIGIYYGTTSILSVVLTILSIFGLFSVYDIGANLDFKIATLVLCAVLGCMIMVCGAIYLLLTALLHKKLNLE